MQPECIPTQLDFEGLGRRAVVGRFDGGRLTTDGGVLLLREVDRRFRVTERLAGCFRDHRSVARIEHRLETLIAQRVLGLAAGYEDLNDHDRLRMDSVLALASGCADVTGERRRRARDRGYALAGSSTLNRLELSVPGAAAGHRYKKIAAEPAAMEALLVELFLEAHAAPPAEIVLDLDATDDPLHGRQEGRFFHGYLYEDPCCQAVVAVRSTAWSHLLRRSGSASGVAGSERVGTGRALGRAPNLYPGGRRRDRRSVPRSRLLAGATFRRRDPSTRSAFCSPIPVRSHATRPSAGRVRPVRELGVSGSRAQATRAPVGTRPVSA